MGACLDFENCRPIECHSTKTIPEHHVPANPYARSSYSAPTNGATHGCGPSRRVVTSVQLQLGVAVIVVVGQQPIAVAESSKALRQPEIARKRSCSAFASCSQASTFTLDDAGGCETGWTRPVWIAAR
jgi:hypothetical protein